MEEKNIIDTNENDNSEIVDDNSSVEKPTTKPKQKRRYVMTEARKQAFERCKKAREERLKKLNEDKLIKATKILEKRGTFEKSSDKLLKRVSTEPTSSEKTEQEGLKRGVPFEKTIEKKEEPKEEGTFEKSSHKTEQEGIKRGVPFRRPKKKVVVYQESSSSDDSSDYEVEIRKKSKRKTSDKLLKRVLTEPTSSEKPNSENPRNMEKTIADILMWV